MPAPKKPAAKKEKKIVPLSTFYIPEQDQIETGILALDVVSGGGVVPGDCIEVSSESGTGKSTLLLDIAKRFVMKGLRVAYLDIENGVKKKLLTSMGLFDVAGPDPEKNQLLLLQPTTYKEIGAVLDQIIGGDSKYEYDVVILDSLSAVGIEDTTIAEGGMDAIGVVARQEKCFFRQYKPIIRKNNAIMFVVKHASVKMEQGFGFFKASTQASGGHASKHYPDMRIWLSGSRKLKRKEYTFGGVEEEVPYGHVAKIRTDKNRNERPLIPIDIAILFGVGISNIFTVASVMKTSGLILNKRSDGRMGWRFSDTIDVVGVAGEEGHQEGKMLAVIKKNYEPLVQWMKDQGMFRLVTPIKEDAS
jgi:RecA/RadA recombinase